MSFSLPGPEDDCDDDDRPGIPAWAVLILVVFALAAVIIFIIVST